MERKTGRSVIEEKLWNERSKEAALRMVKYVGKDKKRLAELMRCLQSSDKRLSEIAAWPLGDYFVAQPAMLSPHIPALLKMLEEKGHHGAVYRCILRAFMEAPIPEKYRGRMIDICFSFIRNAAEEVAIRAFSIKLAANISVHYPEIAGELLQMLREMKEYEEKPAIQATIRYTEKKLAKFI